MIQDSDNELAMGENVDLNEKFVCPPHEGLPIPTQPGFHAVRVSCKVIIWNAIGICSSFIQFF